jgi:hypothetical protein
MNSFLTGELTVMAKTRIQSSKSEKKLDSFTSFSFSNQNNRDR